MTQTSQPAFKVPKSQRLEILKKILLEQEFSEQSALQQALHDKGVETNQTNLSRDLAFLGVQKVKGVYTFGHQQIIHETHSEIQTLMPIGELFALIKLRPGHAQMIASLIDSWNHPCIAGTIAGDDTILVIFPDAASGIQGMDILTQNLPQKGMNHP